MLCGNLPAKCIMRLGICEDACFSCPYVRSLAQMVRDAAGEFPPIAGKCQMLA